MKKFFLTTLICVVSFSCGNDDSDSESESSEFNRSAILVSLADDFIIPQFNEFLEESTQLTEAKNNFLKESNEANLVSLRSALTSAYIAFQPVSVYANMGKGFELDYYLNLNAHPLTVDETETNIANFENVDLTNVFNRDTQGLPAVDYLVNGLGTTDAEIVAFYTGEQAANYKGYLSLVVDRIEDLTQQITDDWTNEFRTTFIENTSSSSAGSFDVFVNEYIEYLEKRLRKSKVGDPAGIDRSTTFPNNIESLYNPILSKELLVAALNNTEALYLGAENSTQSLSSILIDLEKTELDTVIKDSFNAAQTLIDESLNDNLKLQVETDNTKMVSVRDALQSIVVYLKSDLTSAVGVDIAYQDNDND